MDIPTFKDIFLAKITREQGRLSIALRDLFENRQQQVDRNNPAYRNNIEAIAELLETAGRNNGNPILDFITQSFVRKQAILAREIAETDRVTDENRDFGPLTRASRQMFMERELRKFIETYNLEN